MCIFHCVVCKQTLDHWLPHFHFLWPFLISLCCYLCMLYLLSAKHNRIFTNWHNLWSICISVPITCPYLNLFFSFGLHLGYYTSQMSMAACEKYLNVSCFIFAVQLWEALGSCMSCTYSVECRLLYESFQCIFTCCDKYYHHNAKTCAT